MGAVAEVTNGKGLTSHFGSAGTLKLVKSVCLNASCLEFNYFDYWVVIVHIAQIEMAEWVPYFQISSPYVYLSYNVPT